MTKGVFCGLETLSQFTLSTESVDAVLCFEINNIIFGEYFQDICFQQHEGHQSALVFVLKTVKFLTLQKTFRSQRDPNHTVEFVNKGSILEC